MKKKLLLFVVGAPLLAAIFTGIQIYYLLEIWGYKGPDTTFTIKPGEAFARINFRLSKKKLISNPTLFHRYAKLNNLIKKFKVGSYQIKTGANMSEVMNTLVYGTPYTKSVTIPEGKNIFQIASILSKYNVTDRDEFLKAAKSASLARKFGIPASRLEGYLYPETYRFRPNTPAREVINTMINLFRKKTKHITEDKLPVGMNLHQVIILASIVEKETGAPFERPAIAGVFFNRLRKRMRLQSDPTTIYGFYENFKGNLQRKHLREKTPYNTYRIKGLPIGPISNPGVTAINAVINPDQHDYLYFVSQNNGTHVFSKSYKDHLTAVKKYQINSDLRRGRSWRDLKLKNSR